MSSSYKVSLKIADRTLSMETGRLAEQAHGAVVVRYGDTVVMVTACVSPEAREGIDFLPLTVDYEERLYAAGKIPGGFFRREGRPSQEAVLTSRLTDRSLRPLFPKGFRYELQVVVTALSADQENDPDTLAIIGASAALGISSIPFNGPVSATRVGYIDGQIVINPTYTQLQKSDLDLVVVGTSQAVVMAEAGAKEVAESVLMEAIRSGQEVNGEINRLQEELTRACGKPKMEFKPPELNAELTAAMASFLAPHLPRAFAGQSKGEREAVLAELQKEALEKFSPTFPAAEVQAAFEEQVKAEARASILKARRPDGRGLTEIRPITCEVGVLPRTHGSGLFTRGQTQVLAITTLGSLREEQKLDGLSPEESKRFLHHYYFPPFSVGEVRRMGSPGRRETGHGALAERALIPVIPSEEEFPYTIRLVSEVLSSNGSTSMASVCGSSLSLMDAGVPIKTAVAGVAMGLVFQNGNYALLTDIEGMEDAWGDMDFKVAGTAKGVNALQLDLKIPGTSHQIVEEALLRAREARLAILERMSQAISASRPELSKYAPRMIQITVNPDKIRNIIGPGGRTIRSIIEETKVTIEVEDDGTVIIGSTSEEQARKAISIIEDLIREVEVGGVYTGKVTRLASFGAFVEVLPGKEGLVPLSELAEYRPPSVEDVVKVGDEIMVVVTEIDRLGRINLSRRALLQKPPPVPGARVGTGAVAPTPRPPRPYGERGGEERRRYPSGSKPPPPRQGPSRRP